MIHVRQVTRTFGITTAVRDAAFVAHNGSITGLLGANGAGKTTMLRMIAGVLKPDTGGIRVGDIDPAVDPCGAQKHLGALLDHTGLYARLSARENIRYFAQLRRVPAASIEDSVCGVLERLGLTTIADRPTAGFSQGERMKVALGRAIVHRPMHLLLDEPTNGLDVPTVRTFRTLVRELRDSGACVLLSSHVLGEIQELCDRIVVLARGSVVFEGKPEDACERTGCRTLEAAFVRLTESERPAEAEAEASCRAPC